MAIDFGSESVQHTINYGPVPAGSKVLCRTSVEKPLYPCEHDQFVGETRTGLFFLSMKFEVIAGQYEGVRWFDQVYLPARMQTITLSKGQEQICNSWGSKIRAMLESARGINPNDESQKANAARAISGFLDLSDLEIPVVVGINNKPTEKNDNIYWNNTLSRVLTIDKEEYAAIKAGGEIITDGPVVGKEQTKTSTTPINDNRMPWDNVPPSETAATGTDTDRVPFN